MRTQAEAVPGYVWVISVLLFVQRHGPVKAYVFRYKDGLVVLHAHIHHVFYGIDSNGGDIFMGRAVDGVLK